MMIFITTVRHPSYSKSYDRVWGLLADTVESLRAQTDPDIGVVVVCDRSLVLPPDDRVRVVELDWPPVDVARAEAVHSTRYPILDKGRKYAVGIAAALETGTDQIMFVDSDDFVACDLAEFVNANAATGGWFMDRGYVLTPKAFTPLDNFHLRCGTSNIVRADLLGALIPAGLDASWPPEFISEAIDHDVLLRVLGNHKSHAAFFGSLGHKISPFPVRSAVWSLGTGENISDIRLDAAHLMKAQPPGAALSESGRRRFNIPEDRAAAHSPLVPRT